MSTEKFMRCQQFVRGREGGWCNEKGDSGGETIFGVARNSNPNWEGWDAVDDYAQRLGRGSKEFIKAVNADPMLYGMAMDLFEQKYFDPIRGNDIPYEVAVLVYDLSVNSGPARAAKIIQKAIRSSHGDPTVNGKITDEQVQFLSDIFDTDSRQAYLEVLLNKRLKFYHWCIESKPANARFLLGWVHRLEFLADAILGYRPDWLVEEDS